MMSKIEELIWLAFSLLSAWLAWLLFRGNQ